MKKLKIIMVLGLSSVIAGQEYGNAKVIKCKTANQAVIIAFGDDTYNTAKDKLKSEGYIVDQETERLFFKVRDYILSITDIQRKDSKQLEVIAEVCEWSFDTLENKELFNDFFRVYFIKRKISDELDQKIEDHHKITPAFINKCMTYLKKKDKVTEENLKGMGAMDFCIKLYRYTLEQAALQLPSVVAERDRQVEIEYRQEELKKELAEHVQSQTELQRQAEEEAKRIKYKVERQKLQKELKKLQNLWEAKVKKYTKNVKDGHFHYMMEEARLKGIEKKVSDLLAKCNIKMGSTIIVMTDNGNTSLIIEDKNELTLVKAFMGELILPNAGMSQEVLASVKDSTTSLDALSDEQKLTIWSRNKTICSTSK